MYMLTVSHSFTPKQQFVHILIIYRHNYLYTLTACILNRRTLWSTVTRSRPKCTATQYVIWHKICHFIL